MTAQNNLNPDQFRNPLNGQTGRMIPVGWMDIHMARRHREWDSSTPGWRDREGPGSFDRLKSDIAEHGIETPLGLNYDHTSHKAVFGEGNHRLEAAYELGHQAVPVTVHRGQWMSDHFTTMRGIPDVATPQKQFDKPGDSSRPADIFGEQYRARTGSMKIGRELHYKAPPNPE
jgi:hypothetical protein